MHVICRFLLTFIEEMNSTYCTVPVELIINLMNSCKIKVFASNHIFILFAMRTPCSHLISSHYFHHKKLQEPYHNEPQAEERTR
jgi:hypothetical protein